MAVPSQSQTSCTRLQSGSNLLPGGAMEKAHTSQQASSGLRLQDCKIRTAFLFGGLHLNLKSIPEIGFDYGLDYIMLPIFAIHPNLQSFPGTININFQLHTLYLSEIRELNRLIMMCDRLAAHNTYNGTTYFCLLMYFCAYIH